MRRLVGTLLILHGLAHAGAGMWATLGAPRLFITILWWIAMVGFVTAGAGLLGLPRLETRWRPLAITASIASLALLAFFPHPVLVVGAFIDAAILIDSLPFAHDIIARDLGIMLHPPRRQLGKIGSVVAIIAIAYVSVLILTRPWNSTWGVNKSELTAPLPGDEQQAPNGRYLVQYGVTIHAPAAAVWPWLAQLGQDRGGFYSYDWLERGMGDPVHNADRIHPEWQSIARGDFVRAAPPNYLGGIFGHDVGWRVAGVEPGRVLVLENWGAFVLQPLDDSTTRLYVRTRGEGEPSVAAVVLAPVSLLVIEPAHFIMQRGMLLGIRDRAEQAWRNR